MNIWVYSDESGVFDKKHEEFFVYAGLIFLNDESRQECIRKYIKAEKDIREVEKLDNNIEVKANVIKNKHKQKLFRALNGYFKFTVIVRQKDINSNVFNNKKSKQRYLDYAYKIGLKNAMIALIEKGSIIPDNVEGLTVYVDQHTSATNGRYELKEGIEKEFKNGTFNYDYSIFFPPIFKKLKYVQSQQCNSEKQVLIRAADIIANRIYYLARTENFSSINEISNLFCKRLP